MNVPFAIYTRKNIKVFEPKNFKILSHIKSFYPFKVM